MIIPFFLQHVVDAGDVTADYVLFRLPVGYIDREIDVLNMDLQGGTPFCMCHLGYEQNASNPNIKTLKTGIMGQGGDKVSWTGPVRVKCFNLIGFIRPVVLGNLVEMRGAYFEY